MMRKLSVGVCLFSAFLFLEGCTPAGLWTGKASYYTLDWRAQNGAGVCAIVGCGGLKYGIKEVNGHYYYAPLAKFNIFGGFKHTDGNVIDGYSTFKGRVSRKTLFGSEWKASGTKNCRGGDTWDWSAELTDTDISCGDWIDSYLHREKGRLIADSQKAISTTPANDKDSVAETNVEALLSDESALIEECADGTLIITVPVDSNFSR